MSRYLKFFVVILIGLLLRNSLCGEDPLPSDGKSVIKEEPKVNIEQFKRDFEEIAIKAIHKEKIPGISIGIVIGDQVVYLKGFGVRKEGEDEKVDADTVFQLASCSKPVTGTVVAAAISHGYLKWEDKIRMYVPNFKMKDEWVTNEFTIKDALSHRSGLRPFEGDVLEAIGYELNEIISNLQYAEPLNSFRSQYGYQNIMITIGGHAARKASGKKDFTELAKEVLFDPLEMTHSGYSFKDFDRAENKAYGHVKDEQGKWVARYLRHPDAQFGGGGVSSTAHDMSNWLIMYLNDGKFKGKEVIAEKDIKEAYTPQIFSGDKEGVTNFYGMGIVISYDYINGHRFLNHNGAFSVGSRSKIYMLPEKKFGIVILANIFPSGMPEGLAAAASTLFLTGNKEQAMIDYQKSSKAILEQLEMLLEDPSKKDLGREPIPPMDLEKYVGLYKSSYYNFLSIKKVGDALEGVIGKYFVKLDIKHYDGNIFRYSFKTIDGDETSGLLKFKVDKAGNVVGAKMTGFDSGEFKKSS